MFEKNWIPFYNGMTIEEKKFKVETNKSLAKQGG